MIFDKWLFIKCFYVNVLLRNLTVRGALNRSLEGSVNIYGIFVIIWIIKKTSVYKFLEFFACYLM